MSSLALDLDRILSRVDPETAGALERAVRNAIQSAEQRAATTAGSGGLDALGYPIGYFEATAGSFASEPLEAPPELLMQSREPW